MRLLALLAMVVFLSGCTAPEGCVPAMSARDGQSWGTEAGGGSTTLFVRVIDGLSNEAIPGASVTIVYNRDAPEEDCENLNCLFEALAPDGPPPLIRLDLTTDANGLATGHIPTGRAYLVLAAGQNHTEEWTEPAGPSQSEHKLDVRLYPRQWNTSISGLMPIGVSPNVAPTGENPRWSEWQPEPLRFSDENFRNSEVRKRVVGLEFGLTWTVDFLESADLGLGLALEDGNPNWQHDPAEERMPGTYTLHWEFNDYLLAEADLLFEESALEFGALSNGQVVALAPMEYTLTAAADLDYRDIKVEVCGTMFGDSEVEAWDPDVQAHSVDATGGSADDLEASSVGIVLLIVALAMLALRRR